MKSSVHERCWDSFHNQIQPPFNAKQQQKSKKNHEGNQKAAKESKQPRAEGRTAACPRQHNRASTTTGRGEHHEQTVVALAWSCTPASRTLCFVLVLVRVLCLCWVILSIFCYLLSSSRPSKTSSNLVI